MDCRVKTGNDIERVVRARVIPFAGCKGGPPEKPPALDPYSLRMPV